MRAGLEASQKKVAAEKKKLLDATIAAGIGHMEAEVKAAVARGESFVVLDVKLGVDSKAVKKATKILNKEAKTTAILCLSEEEPGSGGKLLCFAVVPEAMQKAGLAANEWVNAALGECGGRGKPALVMPPCSFFALASFCCPPADPPKSHSPA